MTKLEQILENHPDENVVIADGFDSAILGIQEESMRVIYSVRLIIKILKKRMTEEEAIEYLYFNVLGSHIENGPIFCTDI